MHFILSLIIASIDILPANLSCKDQPRVLRSSTLVSADGQRRAYVDVFSIKIAVADENEYPFDRGGICSNTATLHVSIAKGTPFRAVFVAEPTLGAEEANLTLVDWSPDGRYLFGIVSRVGMVGCPVADDRPFLYDATLRSFIHPQMDALFEKRSFRGCSELSIAPVGFSKTGSAIVTASFSAAFDDDSCEEGNELWEFRPAVDAALERAPKS